MNFEVNKLARRIVETKGIDSARETSKEFEKRSISYMLVAAELTCMALECSAISDEIDMEIERAVASSV